MVLLPHVLVLQSSSDIRGLEKLLLIASTPALHGCFFCWIKGFRVCNKTVYCGHHTELPTGHPLRAVIAKLNAAERQQCQGASNNQSYAESLLVPSQRTHEQVQAGET